MKKILFFSLLAGILFIQCSKKESNPFLITKDSVGYLTPDMRMKQLDSVFAKDSIVKLNSSPNAIETQGEVEIYEKGGKRLLTVSPKNETDPNSAIDDIRIVDPRYRTAEGLSLSSTFKDFKETYTVSAIQRIINGIIIFFSDTDIYLTVEERFLPMEIRADLRAKIETDDIDEAASIKYMN